MKPILQNISLSNYLKNNDLYKSYKDKHIFEEEAVSDESKKDDNYDFETGKFTGMSEKTQKLFNENLQYFYKVFSNGKEKPENIKKFSDIKLRDYQKHLECI